MQASLPTPSMIDICQKFPCPPEAMALATQFSTPAVFIDKLRKAKLSQEAVQVLARFLPKEKAVEWAALSARKAGASVGISPEELKALEAAEAWALHPSEDNRLVAADAVSAVPPTTPASLVANAAAFSRELEVPEGELPLEMSGDLTAHFVAGAVMLAAAMLSPIALPEILKAKELFHNLSQEAGLVASLAENAGDQPAPMPPPPEMILKQKKEAANLLDPFLEMGIAIAQSVPGWS